MRLLTYAKRLLKVIVCLVQIASQKGDFAQSGRTIAGLLGLVQFSPPSTCFLICTRHRAAFLAGDIAVPDCKSHRYIRLPTCLLEQAQSSLQAQFSFDFGCPDLEDQSKIVHDYRQPALSPSVSCILTDSSYAACAPVKLLCRLDDSYAIQCQGF